VVIAVVVSLVVGLAGIVASRAAVGRLAARPGVDDQACWALGVAGAVPAWLVVWVALLPTTPGLRPQAIAGAAWMLSAGLALLGAIASVRSLHEELSPRQAWMRGALAIAPAWLIGSLGRLASALGG
jgi:hypothetical protein